MNVPVGGPVLAGQDSVWVDRGPKDVLTVRAAAPGGESRTLFSAQGSDETCHYVESLTASGGRVAFVYRHGDMSWGCFTDYETLIVMRTDGTRELESVYTGYDSHCSPSSVDLDGDLLAVARINCPDDVTIEDLASGDTTERITLPAADREYFGGDTRIQLAGRYIGFHEHHWDHGVVVVHDRQSGAQPVRVPVQPWLGPDTPVNYELRFAMQDDGTVAVAIPDYSHWDDPPAVLWASPADPAVHQVHTDMSPLPQGSGGREIAISGGLIAVRRPQTQDMVVMDLAGRPVDVFDRYAIQPYPPYYHHPFVHGLDFDGKRVAWFNDSVRNAEYPVPEPSGSTSPKNPPPVGTPWSGPDPPPGPPSAPPPESSPPPSGSPPAAGFGEGPAPLTQAGPDAITAPPGCVVPKLRGRSLSRARHTLAARDCRLGRVRRRGGPGPRVVVRQSPSRGTRLRPGARVRVTLGRRAGA